MLFLYFRFLVSKRLERRKGLFFMQHMDSSDEEMTPNWRQEYGRYEGVGQKIRDDDELFASMLARKMKNELGNERNTLASQRLALGIVSVCAAVVLFGLLVLALALGVATRNGEASAALGWGFVATCAVIFAVNGYFNWASRPPDKISVSEQEKKGGQVKTKEAVEDS
jgi:uncharacterized membrane protein YidH (DUF202 family)